MEPLVNSLQDFPQQVTPLEISYDTIRGMNDNDVAQVIVNLLQRVAALEQQVTPINNPISL